MSVEFAFPLEFIVHGTPVSLGTKRPQSKAAWKDRVRQASSTVLPEGHFASDGRITVTLFYFPARKMEGDIDNIVKPILDALSRHVYFDDAQVERVWVQKFEPHNMIDFRDASPALDEASSGDKPALFVRIGNDPTEGLV